MPHRVIVRDCTYWIVVTEGDCNDYLVFDCSGLLQYVPIVKTPPAPFSTSNRQTTDVSYSSIIYSTSVQQA